MSDNDQLRQAAGDYLAIRRRLGFKLQGHDRLLASFLDYLQRSESSTITVQSAVAWATAPAGVSAGYWRDRLCAVRGFARHVQGIDSSTEVPPLELIAGRRQRRTPYLYSQSDIAALMEAAACLRPALRGATYQALFGLLICTGMRVGETIALDRGDVDLRAGMLEIKDAKFRKHRRLPLHGSAVAALGRYAELRDRFCARPKDPSFFVSTRGTRLLYVCVNQVFRKLAEEIGLTAQPRAGRPRIHDLRHGFATASVQDFHRSGADPAGKLPVLSAYLGHADPAYTYIYLHACPELLGLAAKRLERFEEGRR